MPFRKGVPSVLGDRADPDGSSTLIDMHRNPQLPKPLGEDGLEIRTIEMGGRVRDALGIQRAKVPAFGGDNVEQQMMDMNPGTI